MLPADGSGRPAAGADQAQRILDAALACYAREGVKATSIRDVAREAGVTPALVHYYYGDAERLLEEVINARVLPVFGAVRDAVTRVDEEDPGALATGFVNAICQAIEMHPWLPPLWVREIISEGGALRDLLVFIGVNDGNLEEGSFRCDANVSIRPKGTTKLGTRCELKNINSFRFVQRAIDSEVARQTAVLDAGGTITQETRSFDPDTGQTATLRSKEDAHDYRYFPEPDLPPLTLDPPFIERERALVGELPQATRRRYVPQ